MTTKNIPAVSIVIPMYNAEKYIGECLDSILAQTFTDYEVIVVDDCSTDNSAAIVESYINNYTDKNIKLVSLKNNSGSAGIPRNIGISLSRGEYLAFVDSDDIIKDTALEELYPIAKKFDADVVHCERYFQFNDNYQNPTLEGYQTGELVKKPTLISDDFAERVNDLYNRRFQWNVWSKLIRRDFFLANEIKTITGIAEDCLITCCLVCSAPRYVRVPNVINFYRMSSESISRKPLDIQKKFHQWISELKDGFDFFDKFLSKREFFQKRPDAKYLALEVWVRECCGYLQGLYAQFPSWQFDELIRHELEGVKDKDALMAFLFSRMNFFNVQLSHQGNIINQMNAHIQNQNQVILQLQAQLKKLQDE